MKKVFRFFIKGVLPPFFVAWCLYFTGKSLYEYFYYKKLLSKLETEILYIKAKTAVRESRIALLQTEQGRKIFLKQMLRSLEKQ